MKGAGNKMLFKCLCLNFFDNRFADFSGESNGNG